MKRFAIAMLLAICAAGAASNLFAVGDPKKPSGWVYINQIQQYVSSDISWNWTRNKVTIWTGQNYAGDWYLTQMRFDCKDKELRQLVQYQIDRSIFNEDAIIVDKFSEHGGWRPVRPGTIHEKIMNYACELK